METEAKAKVLCLGGKIYSISCRASCFASVDLKEKDEFNLFKELNKFCSQADATTFAISSVSILLLWIIISPKVTSLTNPSSLVVNQ